MKLPLKIIKGNVLILGLIEGYFAYMASLNINVKSISIVEENKELIKFFNEAILPNCNKDVKINIVKGKYQKYIKKIADNDFNYIFCNVGRYNASKYLELKGIFDNFIYTKAIYYREESIITDLSVSLTSALLNERKTPIYEKLNTLKLDNIYDYRKLYSFHGLLDFYKK